MTATTVEALNRGYTPEVAPIHITAPLSREVRSTYRSWRTQILYSVIIGYAAYYLLRQNFSMAIPGMMEDLGYTKIELGWVVTMWSIVYGIGKFVNGFLSDRSNARIFMPAGLLLSAVVCLCMGFMDTLWAIGFLWMFNGWFQSMGWPPAARLVTHWFSPTELGMKWALCSSSHQIGGAIISVFAGYLIVHYGWRSAFYIPALLAIGVAFFLYNRLRDRPQDLGLPPVEEYKGDVRHVSDEYEERVTLKDVIHQVLGNKLVWYMGFANLCLYIPRMGIFVWAPTFLKEIKGTGLLEAGWQVGGFEIAGLAGGLMAGWLSDRFFGGRRGPVGVFFLIGLAASIGLLWAIPAGYPLLDLVALMLAGYLVYGPQILAGVASADFASKKAVGVANGFIGTLAYLGSGIAGVGIGYVVESYGWAGGFTLFIASSLIGAFFFLLVWNRRAKVLEDQGA
ncbi:MFS transporter [Candidatus Bealeia paramacronuclearis]|uniref:MFS transporter n=1 Tax=Candidatus Bealeia paramacronuclearis TaxID=1921001 RepID=A0ABZ2C8P2_9PROT|nr:MFS transporter [Candidatus Bealeia paramacronuclearis]